MNILPGVYFLTIFSRYSASAILWKGFMFEFEPLNTSL
jgi:hypothetical protein